MHRSVKRRKHCFTLDILSNLIGDLSHCEARSAKEIPIRYKTVRQQHLAYCKCNDRSAALSSTLHKLRVTLGETEKYCPFIEDGMLATGLARFGIIASRSAC